MESQETNKSDDQATSCGPDCACNTKTAASSPAKLILLAAIIIVAGAALGYSLMRKSHADSAASPVGYPALSHSAAQDKKQSSPSQPEAFAPLESFAALNTVAKELGGVFVLLVDNDAGKTPAMVQEISAAKNDIASRGLQMGLFQLNRNSPDFDGASAQLKPPGVLVLVKGKGMRGVRGDDITQTNLLQAFMAAMQPSGCCAPGSGKSCK